MGRKFIGIELKESYYNQAVLNLHAAENGTLGVQGSPIEEMGKIIDMTVLDGHLAADLSDSFSFLNPMSKKSNGVFASAIQSVIDENSDYASLM